MNDFEIYQPDNVSTSGAFQGTIPREIQKFAEKISRIHGEVLITRETGGIQLYFASPEALKRDGKKELRGKHCSIGAERYFATGKYTNLKGTYDADAQSCQCMKYGTKYRVSALLQMPPLKERGITDGGAGFRMQDKVRFLIQDGKGNEIPPHPGQTVKLSELDPSHPAVEYLTNRNYDIKQLENQFRACYCLAEWPQSRVENIFYRRMPDGWRDTPQGRIILFIDMLGIQQGWQARVIDKTVTIQGCKCKLHWHPYRSQWVHTHTMVNDKWELTQSYQPETMNGQDFHFTPSKYRNAMHSERNSLLMGLDAAIAWNKAVGLSSCVLAEGPLDAGRLGPPGVAMLGKYCSEMQAAILGKHFKRVIFVADNDDAGKQAIPRVVDVLSRKTDLRILKLPESVKDLGEMEQSDAVAFLAPHIYE